MIGTLTEQQAPPTLLDPDSQPRFVNAVPVPSVINANRPAGYVLQIKEVQQWLGLVDEAGHHLDTTVWGYGQPGQTATYPGPTFVAHQGVPIKVHWDNALPRDGHLLPVDGSILDDKEVQALDAGYVPTVTHLHGGHSPAESDGGPEAWFTQKPSLHGPDFPGQNLDYPNDQQAATLWYHDHALGITRLNVYAGLAGFYLIEDQNEEALVKTGVLPDRAHEFGLAIQDRAFTADGQLYLPAHPEDPIPGTGDAVETVTDADGRTIDPTIVPEFFGDFMLVNGMIWPKMDVQPTTYRFHLLNGSDSRFDILRLDNPNVKVTLVGSDGGLLKNAITVMDGDGKQENGEQIVLGPGERVDAVFDFSRLHAGEHATLENFGPAFDPFQGFAPDGSLANGLESAQGTSVGEIMRFDIGTAPAGLSRASVGDGTLLNPGFVQWTGAEATTTRKLGLFETDDPDTGRTTPLLGVVEEKDGQGHPIAFGPRHYEDPTTEVIRLGATEKWEIYNFTADAHPIHLHQVQFQVLDRHEFHTQDANHDGVPGNAANEVVTGQALPLAPTDLGWQDTVWVAPGQTVSIEAKFDLPGEYVWHCHILSHEDNDMMRPFLVTDQLL